LTTPAQPRYRNEHRHDEDDEEGARMILITGATGNIGREVRRLLEAQRVPIRILARTPSKLGELPESSEVVQGDLWHPERLEAAFAGVDRAFFLFSAGERLPEVAPPVFSAAASAGVKHAVFVSSGTTLMRPPTAIGGWHLAAEEALRATGMAWTFLRPGNFASNTLRWAPTIKAKGAVYATGSGRSTAPIDPRDIAAVAVEALTSEGHEEEAHLLTGPEPMTAREQVETIGRALGRPLELVDVPRDAARAQMVERGMSEALADAVLELTGQDGGDREPVSRTVEEVTGRPARTFETWVRDHLDAFR